MKTKTKLNSNLGKGIKVNIDDKAKEVKSLRDKGKVVAMVGDG